MAMGADAIVIVHADSRGLIASCKRAIAAGVVVVNDRGSFGRAGFVFS